MANKIVTRKRSWYNKAGDRIEKTYTYIVETGGKKTIKGKKQKQKFISTTPVYAGKKQGKLLTQQEALDWVNENIEDPELKFNLKNALKSKRKKYSEEGITQKALERLADKEKLSQTEQFIRNLGYTEAEFESEFNLTKEDLSKGTFNYSDKITTFKSADGKIFSFIWDYERGARLV